jgi:hypothetical protein
MSNAHAIITDFDKELKKSSRVDNLASNMAKKRQSRRPPMKKGKLRVRVNKKNTVSVTASQIVSQLPISTIRKMANKFIRNSSVKVKRRIKRRKTKR